MRTELFRYSWTVAIAICNFLCGAIFMGMSAWTDLNQHHSFPAPGLVGGLAVVTIFVTAFPFWMRKRSKTRPLIIIDDDGLWSWRYGLIPWPEIQTIEWKERRGRIDADIIVVRRHERYMLSRCGLWLMTAKESTGALGGSITS